jgi:hypothetical protein
VPRRIELPVVDEFSGVQLRSWPGARPPSLDPPAAGDRSSTRLDAGLVPLHAIDPAWREAQHSKIEEFDSVHRDSVPVSSENYQGAVQQSLGFRKSVLLDVERPQLSHRPRRSRVVQIREALDWRDECAAA